MTHAIKAGKADIVERLLCMGWDAKLPNKKGYVVSSILIIYLIYVIRIFRSVTPISTAAHKGSIKIMKSLISHGAVVNAINESGSTALIQVRFLNSYIARCEHTLNLILFLGITFWPLRCSKAASVTWCRCRFLQHERHNGANAGVSGGPCRNK